MASGEAPDNPPVEGYLALRVEVPLGSRDWLVEQLEALGFSSFEEQNCETGVRLIVYGTGAGDARRLEATGRRLRASYASSEPDETSCFEVRPVETDWELAWTRHLAPVQLTPRLRLVPSTPDGPPRAGVLHLSPAFAFGFGEHASSRVLASWLEEECRERPGGSLLDVGSGTGVLSLAGLLSGASRSLGLDICSRATAAAQVNAAHNGLGERAEFRCGSVADANERFDCVVANVEPRVLHALAPDIARALVPGGRLGLSGFLADEMPALRERYAQLGMALSLAGSEDGWCVLAGRAGSKAALDGTIASPPQER